MCRKLGDAFGNLVPTIAVLSLAFYLSGANATYDLSVGAEGRSYPLSGVVEGEIGYDGLVWGNPRDPRNPWYGYLRASVNAQSSLNYNSQGAAFELFPLAFLRARVGAEGVQNDSNYSAYDCETYVCRGRFYRDFADAQLALGEGRFFVKGRLHWEHWTQSAAHKTNFIDPSNGVFLSGIGDRELTYQALLGWKWNEHWTLASSFLYVQSYNSDQVARLPLVLLMYNLEPLTVGAGGGYFQSTLKPTDPTVVLFLSWQLKPGLALN